MNKEIVTIQYNITCFFSNTRTTIYFKNMLYINSLSSLIVSFSNWSISSLKMEYHHSFWCKLYNHTVQASSYIN